MSFTVAVALLACSCNSRHTSAGLDASVSSIREYVDSFKGLSLEAARSRLAGAKLSEKEWNSGGYGGKQLVATFPQYQVRVLFLEDKAITTSLQIITKSSTREIPSDP
ncbi:MAG: hypothetical protein JWR26_277 [Pedosphaera sp.]|nr:hypothetical protein [Pedosphaera sp.]